MAFVNEKNPFFNSRFILQKHASVYTIKKIIYFSLSYTHIFFLNKTIKIDHMQINSNTFDSDYVSEQKMDHIKLKHLDSFSELSVDLMDMEIEEFSIGRDQDLNSEDLVEWLEDDDDDTDDSDIYMFLQDVFEEETKPPLMQKSIDNQEQMDALKNQLELSMKKTENTRKVVMQLSLMRKQQNALMLQRAMLTKQTQPHNLNRLNDLMCGKKNYLTNALEQSRKQLKMTRVVPNILPCARVA